ncbi:MAG: Uncharacterised protein [Flavobacteriaceae bacterium]|nr:MAG: Uncharacterised protein [Flavobacteriaceae bacterium]
MGGHGIGSSIADTKTDQLRGVEFHITNPFKVGFLGVAKSIFGSGYTGAAHHIDEAIGNLVNVSDALSRGLGGDEEHIVQMILF